MGGAFLRQRNKLLKTIVLLLSRQAALISYTADSKIKTKS
jgi:hypothetical protein